MNIVLLVRRFLEKEKVEGKMEVPDGYCPNCWGKTEYGGKFYKAVKSRNANLGTKDPQIGWIQEYVKNNLKSIILVKKENSLVCPNCKTSYEEIPES